LDGISIENNTAIQGGAISHNSGGSINILNSRIIQNTATAGQGGAIEVAGVTNLSEFNITRSTLNENTAGDDGGAIALLNGTQLIIKESTLFVNSAQNNGGAIYANSNARVRFLGGDIGYNQAINGSGGVLYAGSSTVDVEITSDGATTDPRYEVQMHNNSAPRGGGGAIYQLGGRLFLGLEESGQISTTFSDNNAGTVSLASGGAIFVRDADFNAVGVINFMNNIAGGSGGAIHASNITGYISAYRNNRPLFIGNNAVDGGAINITISHGVRLEAIDFGTVNEANQATNGGAIASNDSDLELINLNISNNVASTRGAGLYMNGGTININAYMTNSGYPISGGPQQAFACDPTMLAANVYCSMFDANSGDATIKLKNGTLNINRSVIKNAEVAIGASGGSSTDISLNLQNVLLEQNSGTHVILMTSQGNSLNYSIKDSTITNNTSNLTLLHSSDVTSGTIQNSIIWGNTGGNIISATSPLTATCNISQYVDLTGLNVDPVFTSTSRGSYRLSTNSPAIDVCVGTTDFDLDGQTRPFNADGINSALEYDMGAFEFQEVIFVDIIFVNGFE
jgi:predicted outer membrane repeat protein